MFGFMRILPMLVIVAFLAFSVRLSEVVVGVSSISDSAFAETGEKVEPMEDSHAAEDEGHGGSMALTEDSDAKAPVWRDASDSDLDVSDVKIEMFEDLMARRQNLEKMEKEFHVREALLKAAEKELDRKYAELSNLKTEIEGLLNLQETEEKERIESLVKIYEGMKPKDAARIFDTLDLDVLVSVLSKMSERKISPVLAAMNPERARTVTIMLAEEKTLPTL